MKHIVQQSVLSHHPFLIHFMVSLLIVLSCVSCSKDDIIQNPDKPLNVSRNFQFSISPANNFDDETSKSVSLKMKLSISRISIAEEAVGQHAKVLLWDTLITRENLYEFTHKPGEIINTTIT
ncbi:MAG: hypothetical protein EOO02_21395, partial [Chitinophagaceae bacterium]